MRLRGLLDRVEGAGQRGVLRPCLERTLLASNSHPGPGVSRIGHDHKSSKCCERRVLGDGAAVEPYGGDIGRPQSSRRRTARIVQQLMRPASRWLAQGQRLRGDSRPPCSGARRARTLSWWRRSECCSPGSRFRCVDGWRLLPPCKRAVERDAGLLTEAVLVPRASILKDSGERVPASFPSVHPVSASVVRTQVALTADNEERAAFTVAKVASALRAAT